MQGFTRMMFTTVHNVILHVYVCVLCNCKQIKAHLICSLLSRVYLAVLLFSFKKREREKMKSEMKRENYI